MLSHIAVLNMLPSHIPRHMNYDGDDDDNDVDIVHLILLLSAFSRLRHTQNTVRHR